MASDLASLKIKSDYECKSCKKVYSLNVPDVQPRYPNNSLLKAILKITDISKLIATTSFRTKISVPWECCYMSFDVNIIVYCEGITRNTPGVSTKIIGIDTIALLEILPQTEQLDQSWNDVIQDGKQRFFKCKKGHTVLLTYEALNNLVQLFHSLNLLSSSVNFETQCHSHRCDSFHSVTLDLRTDSILPQGSRADVTLYKCKKCNIIQIPLLPISIDFSDLKMSKISGIKRIIEHNEDLTYRTKYDLKCSHCSVKLEMKLEVMMCINPSVFEVKYVLPQHTPIYQTSVAHCLILDDFNQLYQCERCFKNQVITTSSFEDSNISSALTEIDDSGPLFRTIKIGSVKIHLDYRCECGTLIQISVEVQPGSIEWRDVPDHRMDIIEFFYDSEVLKILPKGSPVDSSLMNCMDDQDEEYLDDYPIENIEFEIESNNGEFKKKEMLIFVKTKMNKGFCYLGLDLSNPSSPIIRRPITTYKEKSCCWNNELELDTHNNFSVFSESVEQIPLPHHNNDVLVSTYVSKKMQVESVYQDLLQLAHTIVSHSFRSSTYEEEVTDFIKEKYVYEGTDCQSAGILKCQESQISFYQKKNRRGALKNRVVITDSVGLVYDLPYTGFERIPRLRHSDEVLVVLGLARPWGGFKNEHAPLRCYLLVLRIMVKPLDLSFSQTLTIRN